MSTNTAAGAAPRVMHAPWPPEVVQAVADVLGDTDMGLTGGEIGRLLAEVRVPDPGANLTKRIRLGQALLSRQGQDRAANCVIAFIAKAMTPVRYRERPDVFSLRQQRLDEVLVFVGMRVNDAGVLTRLRGAARTLDEAAAHASSIRAELTRRGTHPAVIASCRTEVLMRNPFHASLEATKGLAQRLREMTSADVDGAKLVDATLALGASGMPLVAINALASASDRDEQTGFATLVKGLFVMYRNPVAHDPRSQRTVTDAELLELLTTLSMVHRRLDKATARRGP